ncbi:hypothetical protein, partial [Bradyrhizobium sp. LjRoot220]|uniref:hypothetical protein n=1 Tax=Bradyrhizobium sp. LjRoot220 TaxID=3342284 RepID=UPI003F505E93
HGWERQRYPSIQVCACVMGFASLYPCHDVSFIHVSEIGPSGGETIMPNWVGPVLALCALVGFIAFAVRQGTKVKPNKDGNPDNSVGGPGGDT